MSPLAQSPHWPAEWGKLSGGGRESAGQRTAQRASPYLAWPAILHAARRLPKSASDGHAAKGWGMARQELFHF